MSAEIDIKELTGRLKERQEKARLGGGKERVDQQHAAGKLTARERIERLCDAGTFVELGLLARHRCTDFEMDKRELPADGVVTGYGLVNGRLVFIFSQDFTVMGGSVGRVHAEKICKIMDMALEAGAPIIGLNDSAGARIQEGVDALSGYGNIFFRNVKASGVVPQISAVMGPCAGGAVYSPALTDFIFMVKGTGQMFITGPDVTRAVTGQSVTMQDLGGATVHGETSGVADVVAENDEECLQKIKALLQHLPSNSSEPPPTATRRDDPRLEDEALANIIPTNPRRVYDMHEVIARVVDDGEFFEVKADFGKSVLTGFARLGGSTVGLVASQTKFLSGALDINASDKAAKFVRFCDSFNIPLVTLMDVPGFLPGIQQEHGGIIRHGAKMLYAYAEATVPKITVIVRKAYGGAYLAMCSKDLGADMVFALPTAEIAVMGPEGAVDIIHRREISSSSDPEGTRRQKIAEYREKFANPYNAAARGFVDDVISPQEIRPRLISALRALSKKKPLVGAPRKHGNTPL
jgi:acetyl-CoA carboxylase carboxyltransferase component